MSETTTDDPVAEKRRAMDAAWAAWCDAQKATREAREAYFAAETAWYRAKNAAENAAERKDA